MDFTVQLVGRNVFLVLQAFSVHWDQHLRFNATKERTVPVDKTIAQYVQLVIIVKKAIQLLKHAQVDITAHSNQVNAQFVKRVITALNIQQPQKYVLMEVTVQQDKVYA